MRATQHTHRGALVRRIASAIGAVAIAAGIAVTGAATSAAAVGQSLPLHNNTAVSTAVTGTGICDLEGLDTTQSYWHFVITQNPFVFESLTLNIGDAQPLSFAAGSYFDNGHPDQAYILVPAGHTITSLQLSGSFADVTPDPTESQVQFVLSHTCTSAPVDVCTNLPEVQTEVPAGYTANDGICTQNPPPPTDLCTNLPEVQTEVPAGYTANNGICTQNPPPPTDLCTNIAEVQTEVPAGYTANNGICTQNPPPPVDVCNNVDGAQSEVPANLSSDGQGGCVAAQVSSDAPVVIDVCPNMAGDQSVVPDGYTLSNGSCDAVASAAVPAPTATPAEVTLPVTGSNTASGIAIGFAMVLAGVVLSVLARRKAARTSV